MTLAYPHTSPLSLAVTASHPYIPARLFFGVYFPFSVYCFQDYSVFLILLLKKHVASNMLQLSYLILSSARYQWWLFCESRSLGAVFTYDS